jgi:acetyl-CoA carboxylase carboxyl transferase subunit alpha
MVNISKIQKKFNELKKMVQDLGIDASKELKHLEEKVKVNSRTELTWKQVELARHPERPYSLDYINRIFDGFIELHGDRAFGDDPAIIGGLAFLDGRPVTVLANQKGRTLKENLRRSHGMANPEGYRKALRLARQAEKFKRPIITFVDTSGAYPGLGAEERGIGEAIARNLMVFSQLKTPVICVIIGEGGSGGALGLCVGDKIYMLENAIYSVISPEGCASILLRDASRAKDAAAMLRITSADLLEFKVINGVIPEPPGGAHTDPAAAARLVKETLVRETAYLSSRNPAVLVRYRNQKIRKIGHWNEGDFRVDNGIKT